MKPKFLTPYVVMSVWKPAHFLKPRISSLMRNFAFSCEQIAKCWATGRGNWLFSETVDGADASSFFMSLVETAKRANIPSNDYIEYVLTFAPYGSEDDSEWEKMLPWNIDLNRLNDHRAMIARAKADENRKEPYVLCGNSR